MNAATLANRHPYRAAPSPRRSRRSGFVKRSTERNTSAHCGLLLSVILELTKMPSVATSILSVFVCRLFVSPSSPQQIGYLRQTQKESTRENERNTKKKKNPLRRKSSGYVCLFGFYGASDCNGGPPSRVVPTYLLNFLSATFLCVKLELTTTMSYRIQFIFFFFSWVATDWAHTHWGRWPTDQCVSYTVNPLNRMTVAK